MFLQLREFLWEKKQKARNYFSFKVVKLSAKINLQTVTILRFFNFFLLKLSHVVPFETIYDINCYGEAINTKLC